MLLTEKLKMPFEKIPLSHKVWWKCDYCGKEFEREIKVINRANKNSPTHSCGSKECKAKKKEDGCMSKYGVSHISKLPEVNAKRIIGIKAKMPQTLEKMKKTNLEKYGNEFASKTDSVKEKMKETCLNKYGSECSLQSDEIKEKSKRTNLEKFGVEFAMQSELVQEKRKQTNLEKFGCEYASQSEEVKQKIIESNLANHGVPYSGMREDVKQKIVQTNIEKYGVPNPLKNEEINNKRKQTNLEKYGTEHTGQVEEFKQKGKETSLEKYGYEYAIQSPIILEKMIRANLKKYGVLSPSMLEEIKEKAKKTCLEKFGTEYPSQSDEIKEKIKNTILKNHGVENALQNPDIKNKQISTMLEKYGHEHALQVGEFKEKFKKTMVEKYGDEAPLQNEEIKEKYKLTSQEKYGTNHPLESEIVRQKIKSTNIEKYGVPCVLLLPENRKYGKTQKEIQEFLNNFGFDFNSNYDIIKNQEIDLYDEQIKIGFEYCGLYWHNELSPQPRTRTYHYNKYKTCKDKGIRLITIFEDEWLHRNAQCKNFIKSILNKNEIKIFARKCQIKQIEKQEFQNFCENYHIQGKNHLAIICYGLFYNDELIGGMSFGKHHRNGAELTLDRLCFKDNITVIGGSSKLFSACVKWAKENGFDKVISWSDNRWSAGGVYEKLGFNLETDGKPDYSYVDLIKNNIRRSKQSQKKKEFSSKTERQICLEKGLARIWDCGKKKWVFNLTSKTSLEQT